MNSLTKVLLEDILEAEKKKVTAIYGGGFKPPTKGHFNVVEKAAKQNPEIDDFIIYVGGGERDGITQGESIQVWELYKKYLPLKVRIEPAKAPIGDILKYAKEHPDEEILWVIGARENNPEDFADIASRTRTIDKYPNLELRVIQTAGGVSGTAARKAIKDNNKEQFFHLIPDIPEKEQVWDIVSPVIKESFMGDIKSKFKKFISAVKQENQETKEVVGLLVHAAQGKIKLSDKDKEYIGNQLKDVLKLVGLTAIATMPGGFIAGALIKLFKAESLVTPSSFITENTIPTIDIIEKCAQLSNHMVEKGYNIKPFPTIEFIDNDIENAENFLGKTAYYDPNEKKIVLYTAGRHPKDIVRSFAHEMIHHMQNLEGRLGDITTTNTTEDDHLNDIEAEANLKGTMSFRNWTDSLKENKDPFGLLEGLLNEGVYDSLVTRLSKDVINAWKSQFDENPKRLFSLLDKNYEEEDAKGRPMEFDLLAKIDFKKTKDRQYKVDGGANEGDDETEGFVALNFTVDPRELPRMWSTIAMDIRDVLRHELEHLTQGGWNVRTGKEMEDDQAIRDLIQKYKILAPKNYFMLDKEVDAMLQGMYYKAKKSRKPFADVIDDYLDMVGLEPEEKEEIKTRWRGRIKALSLPQFESKYKLGKVLKEEETDQQYKIYCDMDGVLVDFDKGYKELTGVETTQADTQGKNEFWNLFRTSLENKKMQEKDYWSNLQWMPDGKELWDHIKPFKPTLLSAPSRDPQSRWGKRIWVKKNIPGTPLILAAAEAKKNYARKNAILIDDRVSNINDWIAAGGIGILHTSTASTLEKLSKYGL